MNIKEALQAASNELLVMPSRHLETRILLSYSLKQSVEYILLNYEKSLSLEEQESFFSLITRRKNFEPIAYIINNKEFYGRKFYVNKNVLIPRDDTETLIELVINQYQGRNNGSVDILDLGTGSGIIAITLALEIQANIVAVDNSTSALEVARHNVQSYGLAQQVKLVHSNWYESLNNKKFDLIVSNPPYIDLSKQALMAKETVMHEPGSALYSGNKGLTDYNLIIKGAKQHLHPTGLLCLEIGFTQFISVLGLLESNGFVATRVQHDLQGHPRAICAKMH